MRRETVDCKSRQTALNRCPWAARVVKVDGGFIAFESVDDYRVWKTQK